MNATNYTISKSLLLAEVETSYKSKIAPEDRQHIGSSSDVAKAFKSV